MSIVTYNQRGYSGCSMSWGAEAAYEDGEMPKSKWTKTKMIQVIEKWMDEEDLFVDVYTMKKDEIFDSYFMWSSWHHTSKYANKTDFYTTNTDALFAASHDTTEEDIARREAYWKIEDEKRKKRLATKNAKIEAFKKKHGCHPESVKAYTIFYPENCDFRTSLKGNEIVEITFNDKSIIYFLKDKFFNIDTHPFGHSFDGLKEDW